MAETVTEKYDPFANFKATIDGLLPDGTEKAQRSLAFADVTIARDLSMGTYRVESVEPIDDNHQREVWRFLLNPDGSGSAILGTRHVSEVESFTYNGLVDLSLGGPVVDLLSTRLEQYSEAVLGKQ